MVAGVTHADINKRLGFNVQNLTQDLAQQLGYDNLEGVIVSQVEPGSPAQFAGIKPGILILEVNRKKIKNVQEFIKGVEDSKDKVLFLIRDQGYSRYVMLQL